MSLQPAIVHSAHHMDTPNVECPQLWPLRPTPHKSVRGPTEAPPGQIGSVCNINICNINGNDSSRAGQRVAHAKQTTPFQSRLMGRCRVGGLTGCCPERYDFFRRPPPPLLNVQWKTRIFKKGGRCIGTSIKISYA